MINKITAVSFFLIFAVMSSFSQNLSGFGSNENLSDEEKTALCIENINGKKNPALFKPCLNLFDKLQQFDKPWGDTLTMQRFLGTLIYVNTQELSDQDHLSFFSSYEKALPLFQDAKHLHEWIKTYLKNSQNILAMLFVEEYMPAHIKKHLQEDGFLDDPDEFNKFLCLVSRAATILEESREVSLEDASPAVLKKFYDYGDFRTYLHASQKEYNEILFNMMVYAPVNAASASKSKVQKAAKQRFHIPYQKQKEYVDKFFAAPKFTLPFINSEDIGAYDNNYYSTQQQAIILLEEVHKYLVKEIKGTYHAQLLDSFYKTSKYKQFNYPPYSWTPHYSKSAVAISIEEKIYISLDYLNRKWIKNNRLTVQKILENENELKKLAKCIAPSFIHESHHQRTYVHFKDTFWEKSSYTKEEEVLAFSNQKAFMLEKEYRHGENYYQDCGDFQKPFANEATPESRAEGYRSVPEALTAQNIKNLLENGKQPAKNFRGEISERLNLYPNSWKNFPPETLNDMLKGNNEDFKFYRSFMDSEMKAIKGRINSLEKALNNQSEDKKKKDLKTAIKEELTKQK